MIREINIDILKEIPNIDKQVYLDIEPLAPLSMVSDMPGSFYKTLSRPNKKMICGLIENVLGWHLDNKIRTSILNDLKKLRKKQKSVYSNYQSGSTYQPLLMDYFDFKDSDIQIVGFKSQIYYNDLWAKSYRRSDAGKTHMDGCKSIDIPVIKEAYASGDLNVWYKTHSGYIPMFYSQQAIREFVDIDATIRYKLSIDSNLLSLLKEAIIENNVSYLGTSEGWTNIKMTII